MSLTKHASFRVLAARIATEGSPLMRTAHRAEFNYVPKPGFLYVRSRAISSRCNDNFDEFPAEEIKAAYRTFIGKPVFVNHHNADHRRARGVIIDAALHEDVNPDGSPDTWAEVLMEVDAVRFPKLAEAIVKGHIERTSMGTDVAYSICSVCGNKAATPLDYCRHIPRMKGQRIYRTTASGTKEGVLVREICYGLGFFENSLLVEEPADPTAFLLGVDARGLAATARTTAAVRTASAPVTRSEARVATKTASKTALLPGEVDKPVIAPAEVDTLRTEKCPVCGEEDAFDGQECQVCGFIAPPPEFGDPDVEKAKQVDLRQDADADSDSEGVSGGALRCDSCGATFADADAAPAKIAVVLDKDKGGADDKAVDVQGKAGDTCPTCGKGTLQVVSPAADGKGAGEFLPAGSAQKNDDTSTGGDGFAPAGSAKKAARRTTLHVARRVGIHVEGGDVDMRPALAALREQQAQIESLRNAVAFIATAAGIESHPIITTALRHTAVDVQESPGSPDGWAIDPKGTEAPAVTSGEAATPQAKDDPTNIGGSPLTDVAPAAVTSVTTTDAVLDEPLDLNEQDPTKVVPGTNGEGAGQSGTNTDEVDVRVGDPNKPTKAFDDGGFLSTGARAMAGLRLARLQIQAGLASGDDLVLGQAIASSNVSNEVLQVQIETLSQVVAARPAAAAPSRRLVPQAERTAARTAPLMTSAASAPEPQIVGSVSDEELAFE